MASGSSVRAKSGSKGFDFGSDDILCSYEDYSAQENSNSNHSDPAAGDVPDKDFQKGRTARQSPFPQSYSPQEDSFNRDVLSTVEKTMKKHADNLMRFLEGISSRLSQLELYCYNLDKSIGEMRSDLVRNHGESDTKLKVLEKHIQEVHRSVQILRDKQELADTQKELAKLQLAHKDGSSKQGEERTMPSDTQNLDDSPETKNQKLALALPQQVNPQPHFSSRPMEHPQSLPPPHHLPHSQPPPPAATQPPPYYSTTPPVPNPLPHQQSVQYLPSDAQYPTPQLGTKAQQQIGLPHYAHMWPSPPLQSLQQQPVQTLMRSLPPQSGYPPYAPHTPISGMVTNSAVMEAAPFPGSGRGNAIPYGGYNDMGRAVQQQPSLHPQAQPPRLLKSGLGSQVGDAFSASGQNLGYESEVGRMHRLQSQGQGGYTPMRSSSQPQFARTGPYGELVEKLVSMGYRGDHVFDVIQGVEESGQTVDFNSVLDRLNGHSSGPSQRGGW